jgi:hypothetical protein
MPFCFSVAFRLACLSTYLYVYMSSCLLVQLYVRHLSDLCILACLFSCQPFCLPVYVLVCLSVCLLMSVYLPICLWICLPVYLQASTHGTHTQRPAAVAQLKTDNYHT